MKPHYLPIALVIFLAGGAPNDDLQRIGGTWAAQVLEAGGKTLTAKDRDMYKFRMTVQGNKYVILYENQQLSSGTLRLDPSTKPHSIDSTLNDGPAESRVHNGIYEFRGNDLLLIFAEPGQPRPTQFKTRPGSQEMMILYRRLAK